MTPTSGDFASHHEVGHARKKRKRTDLEWDVSDISGDAWSLDDALVSVEGEHRDWPIILPSIKDISSWCAMDFHWFAFQCLMAYRHMFPKSLAAETLTIKSHDRTIDVPVPFPVPPFVTLSLKLYFESAKLAEANLAASASPTCGYLTGLIRLSLHDRQLQNGIAAMAQVQTMIDRNKASTKQVTPEEIIEEVRKRSATTKQEAFKKAAKALNISVRTLQARITKFELRSQLDKFFNQ